ncbi:MAG: hypothetical protein ACYS67_02485 [Planctomycetota bacterium]|jgi:hypothetical protein
MLKTYVKLGLLLLVIGSALIGWVLVENNKDQQRAAFYKTKYGSDPDQYLKQYNEWLQLPPEQRANLPWWLDKYGKTKSEDQLQKEQQERLNADLEKLATGKKEANPFADILYGDHWRKKLDEYKKQRRMRGHIFTGSIVCALIGGAIVTCCLVLFLYQIIMKTSSNLKKTDPVTSGDHSPTKDIKMARAVEKEKIIPNDGNKAKTKVSTEKIVESEVISKATTKKSGRPKIEVRAKNEDKTKEKADTVKAAKTNKTKGKARGKAKTKQKVRSKAEKKPKVKENIIAKTETEKMANVERESKEESKTENEAKVSAEEEKIIAETEKAAKAESESKEEGKTENEAKVSVEEEKTEDQQKEKPELHGKETEQTKALGKSDWKTYEKNSDRRTIVLNPPDEQPIELVESLEKAAENINLSDKTEDPLKDKTENIEKQMEEFRQTARGVQQTAIENSEPINNTLNELAQQVSAIREYASSQQDRLSKLQDGYDWNITKTFCVRVIRCIDNLEKRISQLMEKNMDVTDLEEIRDEMLFALESSGVEQYEPELNSDYHGQEKFAEAVKGKENCNNKNQKGKIAKIIRPGYQFFINEENVKIVRPAQVKLYG